MPRNDNEATIPTSHAPVVVLVELNALGARRSTALADEAKLVRQVRQLGTEILVQFAYALVGLADDFLVSSFSASPPCR
jgi:hypothetical protein